MLARSLVITLAAALLFGCARKQEIESLDRRVGADEAVIASELQKNEAMRTELLAAIDRVERKLDAMEYEQAQTVQALADRTVLLERKMEEVDQLRKQAELKKTAADQEKQQALEAVRKANQPAPHPQQANPPFRVFDVLFVGRQTHDGHTGDFGMFSIRNYTAEPLEVRASSGYRPGVSVTIPANSSQAGIYVQASKEHPLHVSTKLGSRVCQWEN